MKLEQSFDVAAPIDRVWRTLVDVEHVAPCMPGAAVTGRNDDGSYAGSFTIKIGPTSASYTGRLEMEDIDESTHAATMQASGTDRRGQGGARATIVSKLTEQGANSTRVEVDTDYHITGRLARFGRGGMIEDISQRLLREFATRLQASLDVGGGVAHGSEAPPAGSPEAAELADAATVGAPDQVAEPPSEAPAPPSAPPPAGPPVSPAPVVESGPAEPLDGISLITSVIVDRVKRNPAPVIAAAVLALFGLLRRRRRRRRRARRRARSEGN